MRVGKEKKQVQNFAVGIGPESRATLPFAAASLKTVLDPGVFLTATEKENWSTIPPHIGGVLWLAFANHLSS